MSLAAVVGGSGSGTARQSRSRSETLFDCPSNSSFWKKWHLYLMVCSWTLLMTLSELYHLSFRVLCLFRKKLSCFCLHSCSVTEEACERIPRASYVDSGHLGGDEWQRIISYYQPLHLLWASSIFFYWSTNSQLHFPFMAPREEGRNAPRDWVFTHQTGNSTSCIHGGTQFWYCPFALS